MILKHPQVGLAAYRREGFKAFEIIGSALDPAAQVTDIKVVRCLGLNYADHAVRPYLIQSSPWDTHNLY